MRLKDGFQTCPSCGGSGCYWCRHQGYQAQCPSCGNQEPELLILADEHFQCLACKTQFEKTGEITPVEAIKKSVEARGTARKK